MKYTFYDILMIFCIYSFLGWCCEVAYAAVCTGKFVNRGFLNGPVCPIYGWGMVIVVLALTPIADNIFILFFGSVVLTSLLEFITGFVLEKFFNDKWWDYSNAPFNIMGYVCLKFSILWGLACVFVMKLVHPAIVKFIHIIPEVAGIVFLCIAFVLFLADTTVTVFAMFHIKKKIRIVEDISHQLHIMSDKFGENISDGVITFVEKTENTRKDIALRKDELKEKFKKTTQEKNFSLNRLLKAFPHLENGRYSSAVEKIKSHFDK